MFDNYPTEVYERECEEVYQHVYEYTACNCYKHYSHIWCPILGVMCEQPEISFEIDMISSSPPQPVYGRRAHLFISDQTNSIVDFF